MAKTNHNLEHLLLYGETNALKEVVCSFYFDCVDVKQEDVQNALNSALISIASMEVGTYESEPPSELHSHSQTITVGIGSSEPSINRIGYSLNLVDKTNHKVSWVIRGLVDPANRLVITIHGLQYTRWFNYLTSIIRFVEKMSDMPQELKLIAYGVQKNDEMYWSHSNYPELKQIISLNSEWIPKRLLESNNEFNYSLSNGSTVPNEQQRRIDQIKFSLSQVGLSVHPYTLSLSHHLVMEYLPNTRPYIVDLFSQDKLLKLLQFCHDENKKMIDSILTDAVKIKMIGFYDKPIVNK